MKRVVWGLWLGVFGYFVWWGATHPAWEGDSLAYHIPVARMINEGKWLEKASFVEPWFYYPAMGETLLAGWMAVGFPINWYNLAGWVILTGLVFGLGRRVGLSKDLAGVAAVAVAMWPTIIRLIPTQTVDIWLAVWWVGAALKLSISNYQLPIRRRKHNWVILGVCLGMLIGTKYSGLLFAAALMGVFWSRWWKEGLDNLYWIMPMMVVGGFWYVRNWLLTGNPMPLFGNDYFAMFGTPVLVVARSGIGTMLSGLVSEYLVWAGLLLLPIWIRNKWVGVGILNFLIYFWLLPSRPESFVSGLRYTLVAFIPLLVVGFKWLAKKGERETLAVVAILGMAAGLTQLDYHPKLFGLLGFLYLVYIRVMKRSDWLNNIFVHKYK